LDERYIDMLRSSDTILIPDMPDLNLYPHSVFPDFCLISLKSSPQSISFQEKDLSWTIKEGTILDLITSKLLKTEYSPEYINEFFRYSHPTLIREDIFEKYFGEAYYLVPKFSIFGLAKIEIAP